MSLLLVVTGMLVHLLLVILPYTKLMNCVLGIGFRPLIYFCSVRYRTTLVSPLGQGWSAYNFCNYSLNAALFSPMGRGIAGPVLNSILDSRQ